MDDKYNTECPQTPLNIIMAQKSMKYSPKNALPDINARMAKRSKDIAKQLGEHSPTASADFRTPAFQSLLKSGQKFDPMTSRNLDKLASTHFTPGLNK